MHKMISIVELAKVIRSKNAKSFRLTFDIVFKDLETYKKVKKTEVITKKLIAKLYHIPVEHVTALTWFEPGRAVKTTIIRPLPCGNPGDTDVFGMQQHAPLYSIKIPWKQ